MMIALAATAWFGKHEDQRSHVHHLQSIMFFAAVLGSGCMLMPVAWWPAMSTAAIHQLINHIVDLVFFSTIGLFGLGIISQQPYNLIQKRWRWSHYLIFAVLGGLLILPAVLSILPIAPTAFYSIDFCVGLLMITPIQSLAEEILCRGALLNAMLRDKTHKCGKAFAIVGQGLYFGFMHLFQGIALLSMIGFIAVVPHIPIDPIFTASLFCVTMMAIGFYCHWFGWQDILNRLIWQSSFGIAAGILAYWSSGLEIGAFWHALHNDFCFIIERADVIGHVTPFLAFICNYLIMNPPLECVLMIVFTLIIAQCCRWAWQNAFWLHDQSELQKNPTPQAVMRQWYDRLANDNPLKALCQHALTLIKNPPEQKESKEGAQDDKHKMLPSGVLEACKLEDKNVGRLIAEMKQLEAPQNDLLESVLSVA